VEDLTVADLYEKAISWESRVRDLYLWLADVCAELPEVRDFWSQMAADESRHVALLTRIRDGLTAGQLGETLDESLVMSARAVDRELSLVSTAMLDTLDAAYELAHRLESCEINAVFTALAAGSDPELAHELLENQLEDHVGRLTAFGLAYDRATRRSVSLEA
jgi:rubrerythrin